MGKGDFRKKEVKKQKKDGKKLIATSVLQANPQVEVIKSKGKKEKPTEEE